jgi:lysozyme
VILQSLINQLKRDEGFRSFAYQDSLGFWTIGYGKLIDERKGGGITIEEATYLLENEIVRKISQLDFYIPWWRDLDHVRQHVLINMCFNLGIHGLLGFKNTLARIKAGLYKEAAQNMLLSKWASQVPNRAFRLSEMMKTGEE